MCDVLEYLAGGMSEEEILNDFPALTRSDFRGRRRPLEGLFLLAFDRFRIKVRRDSESGGLYGPWGFDSPLRHQRFQ